MSFPRNFPIDAATLPVNPAPTLISGAMEIDMLNTVTELTPLMQTYNLYYEPTQIRIVNNSSASLWWMVTTFDEKARALLHPSNFNFVELGAGMVVNNPVTRGRYIYLYSSVVNSGIVTIQGFNYWLYSQDHIAV